MWAIKKCANEPKPCQVRGGRSKMRERTQAGSRVRLALKNARTNPSGVRCEVGDRKCANEPKLGQFGSRVQKRANEPERVRCEVGAQESVNEPKPVRVRGLR
jgi:hypothetical protein